MAIVTISRGTFSGGSRLASCLGTTLGYRVISREVLAEAAQEYGVLEETLLEGLRDAPSFWDRFRVDRQAYLAVITAAACRIVRDDNVVYHGHAGHFLLPDLDHILRVRVVAPLPQRVAEAMAAHGFDRHEAEDHIRRLDEERSSWTRFLYRVDWQDPTLYDIVLNLEKITVEAACRLIAELVGRPELAVTSEGARKLADHHLVAHVRAKLFLNPRIAAAADRIEVTAADGEVELSGLLPDERTREHVLATVEAIPEVRSIRSEWLGSHLEPV